MNVLWLLIFIKCLFDITLTDEILKEVLHINLVLAITKTKEKLKNKPNRSHCSKVWFFIHGAIGFYLSK